jgi:outer membrane protein
MRTKKIIFAFGFLISLISRAQNAPLTLDQAIALSLENNYDIQLTRSDSLLAALDYAYSNYSLLPRLTANGAMIYNNNNSRQVLADGSEKERNGIKSSNLNASLNLDWTLFDGFQMFISRNRLNQLVKLSELQIKSQVITTVATVMQTYYDIIRQEQLLKAIQEQIGLSTERLKLAQYKFDIGTGAKPDVLQAQIDLNAQRSSELTQQTAINKLKEQFNQLLVLPVGNDFAIADTTIEFNPNLTLDSVSTQVTTTSPELLIAQKNLDIANIDLRLRRAERYPTVHFTSAYNFTRNNNQSVINQFQPLFNQTHGLNYGLVASIPILNGFTNRRDIRAAELTLKSQQLSYDRSLALVQTDIANAYKDYDLYKRSLALEEENIKLVEENLYIARERYRLGISTFLEMRTAEQSVADARSRLITARYNTKIAEIELMRLKGNIIR